MNLDLLIDEISDDEFNLDERLPYWAEIWPSAIALSQFLAEYDNLEDKSLLDIGSGLGLTGIVAAKKKAKVVFSDYEDIALEFCSHNAQLNKIDSFKTLNLDWRNAKLEESFDIITAADVVYEKRFLEPVLNLISSLLKPGGKAIIAEPGRNVANDFFDMLKQKDISHKKFKKVILYNGKNQDIDIHVLN